MYVTQEKGAGARGFTLVELLVVVAIIGILAGIVVPNVTRYIRKGRMARAVSEIRNADTALAGMLADAGRSRFSDFMPSATKDTLKDLDLSIPANVKTASNLYTEFFYDLLRNGREASQDLVPEVKTKLGASYMNLGADPWGNRYNFWIGPYPRSAGAIPFRSFRAVDEDDDPPYYVYDDAARTAADQKIPGNPPKDDMDGFPAPRTFPVYIWSAGPNQTIDAFVLTAAYYLSDEVFRGGGDDLNNWDNEAGWNDAPE